MQLTGGQMVVQYLISEGVEHVFAIPGHGNTALLDAFVDRVLRGVDNELGSTRGFVRRSDAGELLDFAAPGAAI